MRTRSCLTAGILLLAALGCRNDAVLPTQSEPTTSSAMSAAAALAFSQLSAGSVHTCGVTTESRAYCWGFNGHGGLGRPSTHQDPNPEPSAVCFG